MWPNSSERVSRVGDGFSGQQGKENVASCPRPLILPGTPTDKASPRQPLMPSFPVSWLSGQGPSLSLNFAATLLLPFFWKPKGDISSEKPPQPWQAEVRALPGQPLPGILFPAFTNAFSIHCPRAWPQDRAHVGTTNSILWFKPQTQESSGFLSLISWPTSDPSSNSISSNFEVHPAPTTSPRLHCPCGWSLCSLHITCQHKRSC